MTITAAGLTTSFTDPTTGQPVEFVVKGVDRYDPSTGEQSTATTPVSRFCSPPYEFVDVFEDGTKVSMSKMVLPNDALTFTPEREMEVNITSHGTWQIDGVEPLIKGVTLIAYILNLRQ